MATPQDTTKADQAKRARRDDAVAAAQADEPAAAAELAKQRVLRAHAMVAEAVTRQNAGECPVIVDDDDGPGTGKFCGAGKLGHEGEHAA